jgi:Rrf2 family protein
MLKLTKKADYGLIALKHLAESGVSSSAKDIAEEYGLPQEALAKILQRLVKSGMLASQHGTNGGYTLARSAKLISAFEVIKAIDGPLFITACSSHVGECDQSSKCNVKEPLRKVNHGIRELLSKISIADMMDPAGDELESKPRNAASNLVTLA